MNDEPEYDEEYEEEPERRPDRRKGMTPKQLEADHITRRAQALELKLRGLNYRQIGEIMECSAAAAGQLVRRELQRHREENNERAEELRQIAHARHETLIRRLWLQAMPKQTENDPNPKLDLDAVAKIINVIEKDSKIMGYSMPAKHQVDITHLQGQIAMVVEVIARVLPDDEVPKVYAAIDEAMGVIASRELSLEGGQ